MRLSAVINRCRGVLKCTTVRVVSNRAFSVKGIPFVGKNTQFNVFGKGRINIGANFGARQRCEFIASDGELIIGNECFFNNNCQIVCHEKVEIGDGVRFGPNVTVYDHDHDFRDEEWPQSEKYKCTPVSIGGGVGLRPIV